MIFVTVGTQLPFDRLIGAVDAWAGRTGRDDVFAQIGPSKLRPRHITFAPFIEPAEHRRHTQEAEVIIGHAGMGTILGALELGKPVVVMPRLARLGEHRSDHQVATADRFGARADVTVAPDEHALAGILDRLEQLHAGRRISGVASDRLIQTLRDFIHGTTAASPA